jgi:hypothetical protein
MSSFVGLRDLVDEPRRQRPTESDTCWLVYDERSGLVARREQDRVRRHAPVARAKVNHFLWGLRCERRWRRAAKAHTRWRVSFLVARRTEDGLRSRRRDLRHERRWQRAPKAHTTWRVSCLVARRRVDRVRERDAGQAAAGDLGHAARRKGGAEVDARRQRRTLASSSLGLVAHAEAAVARSRLRPRPPRDRRTGGGRDLLDLLPISRLRELPRHRAARGGALVTGGRATLRDIGRALRIGGIVLADANHGRPLARH